MRTRQERKGTLRTAYKDTKQKQKGSKTKTTMATKNDDDYEATTLATRRAKQIIEEELRKSQEEAKVKREQKMKAFVGDGAPQINDRKSNIQHHQQQYSIKGREHLLVDDANNGNNTTSFSPGGGGVKSPSSVSSSSGVSPIKKYKEIADKNAMTSTINSPSLFAAPDPVKQRQLELQQQEAQQLKHKVNPKDETSLIPDGWYSGPHFYTLVEIRQKLVPIANQPEYKNRREEFLSSEEFSKAFGGLTKLEFIQQPKWKRDKLKQSLYLF